jgi:hypothetical protein
MAAVYLMSDLGGNPQKSLFCLKSTTLKQFPTLLFLLFVFVPFARAQTAEEHYKAGVAKMGQHLYPEAIAEFGLAIDLFHQSHFAAA